MSILQEWVEKLGLRHQGVLLGAIRGCDTAEKYAASKVIARALRSDTLISHCGDPAKSKSFIEVLSDERFEGAVNEFFCEWDCLPMHYIMHAAEVMGFYHPDLHQRLRWLYFYHRAVHRLHLHPESRQELDERLNADEHSFKKAEDIGVIS
jgi:hypothetical protein